MNRQYISRLVRNVLISFGVYMVTLIVGLFLFLHQSITEILAVIKDSPVFWLGLITVVIINLLIVEAINRKKNTASRLVFLITPFLIIGIGYFLLMLAYAKSLWQNPPYTASPFDPSVFGAGVSVIALGFAFLFVFYPMTHKEDKALEETVLQVQEKFSRLSFEADKLDKTSAEYSAILERAKGRIENSDIEKKLVELRDKLDKLDRVVTTFLDESRNTARKIDKASK